MNRYNLPFSHPDQTVETASLDAKYVIRGPNQCPGISDSRNVKCEPVNGIPYRTGFFLIQAFNGQYLENAKIGGDASYYLKARFSSHTYENVSKEAKPFPKHGLSRKTTEWILHFHGDNQELFENYFQIGSGCSEYDHLSERFLTLEMSGAKTKLTLVRKMTPDQTPDKSQRWYMKYTRNEYGNVEVKIYTKWPNSETKYYLTFPWKDFQEYSEYHTYIPGVSFHVSHTKKSDLEIDTDDFQISTQQTFRLLECDYGLDSGEEKRKIVRRAVSIYFHSKFFDFQICAFHIAYK